MFTPPASTIRSPATFNFLRVLTPFAAAGTLIAVVLTIVGFAARYHWRLEQACHFRVQYFWSLLLAAVVLWAAKRPRIATLALIASLTNFAVIAPILWPVQSANSSGPRLRIVSFNLLLHNSEYENVTQFLRQQKADIVLLMEVTPQWGTALETLRDAYPHQHVVHRSDAFGIALLSQHQWQEIQTIDLNNSDLPSIVSRFDFEGGKPFAFVGTHPLPPGSQILAQERNAHLAAVAKFVRELPGPVILAGDLNVTDFSPYFHDLLTVSGLRDTRQGRGIQPTWGPLPGLEIPIDHCLISPQIATRTRRIGPRLGSDHRPLIIELNLPPE